VRHLTPSAVVETGVARGLTSGVILEALAANGKGHVWSVDLPPLFNPGMHSQTGAAIPGRRHNRWTCVRGSSRRRLPRLLSELGNIDMFIHNSLHTARNIRFEMRLTWPALRPGGIMLVDDVYNQSFGDFIRQADQTGFGVYRSADGTWMFGAARRADHSTRMANYRRK
jgi:hypothetical protein